SIHTKDTDAAGGHAEVEKARLHAEPWRVRLQPDGKGILKGLFYFPLSQRTIQLKGRIAPIELHSELIVNKTPMHMQCLYIVFTHGRLYCQWFLCLFAVLPEQKLLGHRHRSISAFATAT